MVWSTPKGFNIRENAGFITDGTNQHAVVAGDNYPTNLTIGGETVTCGWGSSVSGQTRDRSTTPGPRFAGLMFWGNGSSPVYFRVDLGATGVHKIRLACGDYQYEDTGAHEHSLREGATAFSTFSTEDTREAGHFWDAAGAGQWEYTEWDGNQTEVQHDFTGTDFRVYIGRASGGGGNSAIAHLYLEAVAGGGGTEHEGAVDFVGVGTMAAAGSVGATGAAALAAAGALAAQGRLEAVGAVAMSAAGTLSAYGVVVPAGGAPSPCAGRSCARLSVFPRSFPPRR